MSAKAWEWTALVAVFFGALFFSLFHASLRGFSNRTG